MARHRTVITYGDGITKKTVDREIVWSPVSDDDHKFLQAEFEQYSKDPWGHHTAEFIAIARKRLMELRPSALLPPNEFGEQEISTVPFEQYEVHNELAWYYWQLIELDRHVRRLIESGQTEGAVVAALTYGQIIAEMRIKFHWEKAALAGKKSLEGAAAGGRARGSADSTNEKRNRLLAEYDARVSHMDPVNARRYAARAVGYSERQARRIIVIAK